MALQLTELLPAISFQVLKLTTKLHCISNDSTFPNGIVLQKLPFLKIQGTFGISYNENGLYHSHTKALMLPFAFCTISLLFHKKNCKMLNYTHFWQFHFIFFPHTRKCGHFTKRFMVLNKMLCRFGSSKNMQCREVSSLESWNSLSFFTTFHDMVEFIHMNDGHNLVVERVYFVSFSYFLEMEKRGEAIKMHSPSINFTFSSVY